MVGRTLLLTAGVALVLGVLLLVAAWKVFSYPARRKHADHRPAAQREALLSLVAAAAAAVAVFRRPA